MMKNDGDDDDACSGGDDNDIDFDSTISGDFFPHNPSCLTIYPVGIPGGRRETNIASNVAMAFPLPGMVRRGVGLRGLKGLRGTEGDC